jgi:hypothetical protein
MRSILYWKTISIIYREYSDYRTIIWSETLAQDLHPLRIAPAVAMYQGIVGQSFPGRRG